MHDMATHPPLTMEPPPGERIVRHIGDRIQFRLNGCSASGSQAFLRTNLTRGARSREETLALAGLAESEARSFAGASWRDIPLQADEKGWHLDLPLTEVGSFRAKAYVVDPEGCQHWPDGSDLGISVLPDHLRTGNTLYCAFPRLFGPARNQRSTALPSLEAQLRTLDAQGYTVIPPSGRLRDLTAAVPHIVETLGCRILHLLPIGPTPTTFARMGRFGSPYAQMDMAGIDPALVEFDQRTTAEDQFRELATAVHLRGGLVFLDIVVNHTGWGSRLMAEHPEWFHRNADGTFHSPGAWGTTWEDLVELDQNRTDLWESVAESLVTWCRRGVDGFRCDAGYMVPIAAWQYLIARVRQEFPDTTFLLEGLGGAWEATEALLTEGGMQWAYSELFQNFDPTSVSSYLDHALRQARRMGPLVHYSETHDNARLAARGRTWSLLRNRLCALTSVSGAFGFTCGVEWLADEKVAVHGATGLAWDAQENLVEDLARLNQLLRDHPCFFDGALVERLSTDASPVLALRRTSAEGLDRCLVLVNLDPDHGHGIELEGADWRGLGSPTSDLLGQPLPERHPAPDGGLTLLLGPGESFCLSEQTAPIGLAGEAYRTARAQAAWAYRHLAQVLPVEHIGPADWRELAVRVDRDPGAFLAALPRLRLDRVQHYLMAALDEALDCEGYAPVVDWAAPDAHRITVVPPDHWLLVRDEDPFALTYQHAGKRRLHLRSVPWAGGHFAAIFPVHLDPGPEGSADASLQVVRYRGEGRITRGTLRLAPRSPKVDLDQPEGLVLLTNGRGAMARIHADLGRIRSKYDALLAVNLHPDVPCDRHVLAKRLRAWAIADGFLTALNGENLASLDPASPARWTFAVHAGDGRSVGVQLEAELLEGRNTLRLAFTRLEDPALTTLPSDRALRLTLRLDLEDRGYHMETLASDGAEAFFQAATAALPDGFRFAPAADRTIHAQLPGAAFHPDPEWSWNLPHTIEAERGMRDRGDAWSPGWFDLPLAAGQTAVLLLDAESERPATVTPHAIAREPRLTFETVLRRAASAFLARRGEGRTVIAGYPWFLDWGRDTLIACRGLLAAGWTSDVHAILRTYACFEDRGTLPNMLSGESTANRETSDAPLWLALAVEEAAAQDPSLLREPLEDGRTLLDVLTSIAIHHLAGTAVGVRVDPESGLVWSPPHFTWMDTNHPAGSPREGYPIELQALWIRLLATLEREKVPGDWADVRTRARTSLERFWRPGCPWPSDCLRAGGGIPASQAVPDGALRPNMLFLVSLGVVTGRPAQAIVEAAGRYLLIPGGLRSLAPLSVPEPIIVRDGAGRDLNDPWNPYWGRYEGDEDTRRKPAYHNGTAWGWPLGVYAEALAAAWDRAPAAVAAARAVLASCDRLLSEGCLGHLPEILDGDAPHQARGCDAQAWSATEVLRVWLKHS